MSNDIALPQSGNISRPRLSVKKLMVHHLRPFAIVREHWAAINLVEKHKLFAGRNIQGKLYALNDLPRSRMEALALRDQLPALVAIEAAVDTVREAINEPTEDKIARLLVGTLLDGLRMKPGDSAPVYADALVWLLEEVGLDDYEVMIGVPACMCSAAIASAIKQSWLDFTFPPSPHEFVTLCREHRLQLTQGMLSLFRIERMHEAVEEVLIATGDIEVSVGEISDEIPF